MLKKFLSIALCIVITFTLFACGSNSSISSDSSSSGGSNGNLKSQIENLNSLTDTIKFGTGTDNEPIEWYILEDNGSEALLLSKYLLAYKGYNEEQKDITWENCTIRKWLNSDFVNSSFTRNEQKSIIVTDIINNDNEYNVKGGNTTKDKLFLLSVDESKKYLSGKMKAEGKSNGGTIIPINFYTWWLRSPGDAQDKAAYIDNGSEYFFGTYVYVEYGIRPAMWVKY